MKTRKFAVAAAIGGFSLFTGLTAAGALPGAAQQAAADALAKVGITVPSPNSHAGDHANSRGTSGDHAGTDTQSTDGSTTPTTTKGSEISNLARTTDSTGVDKGAEISTTASGGKSQAGADHTTTAGTAGADHAVEPPTTTSTVPSQADGGISHKPGSHP